MGDLEKISFEDALRRVGTAEQDDWEDLVENCPDAEELLVGARTALRKLKELLFSPNTSLAQVLRKFYEATNPEDPVDAISHKKSTTRFTNLMRSLAVQLDLLGGLPSHPNIVTRKALREEWMEQSLSVLTIQHLINLFFQSGRFSTRPFQVWMTQGEPAYMRNLVPLGKENTMAQKKLKELFVFAGVMDANENLIMESTE